MNKLADYPTPGRLRHCCLSFVVLFSSCPFCRDTAAAFCEGTRVVKTLISDWKDSFDANDVLRNARLMILPCYGDDDQ